MMQTIVNQIKTKVNLINELALKVSQYDNFLLYFYECNLQDSNKILQIKLFNDKDDNPNSRLLDEISIKLENTLAMNWLELLLDLIYQKNQYKLNFIEKSLEQNANLYTWEHDTKTYIVNKIGKKYFNTQTNTDVVNYCNWNIFSFLVSFYHIYYQDKLEPINIVNDKNMIINKINELIVKNHETVSKLKMIDWFLFFEITINKTNELIKITYNLVNNKEIIQQNNLTVSLININELKSCLAVINYLCHLNNDILLLIRRLILDVTSKFLEYNKKTETWSLSALGSVLVENISYKNFIEKLIDYKIEKIRREQ